MLALLGGGSLLVIIDCLRSRYPVINMGTASMRYFPTIVGEIGIIIFLIYPLYLIIRLIVWGTKKGLKKFTPLCLLVFSLLLIAGCYETKEEIISASEAVRLEGLPEIYYENTFTLSMVKGSNDYHFAKTAQKDSPAESGTARLFPLKDNIYILQAKPDSCKNYLIMFVKWINNPGDKGKELKAVYPQVALDPTPYEVKLKVENLVENILTGNRKDIMDFLKTYADVKFSEQPPELSKMEDKIKEATN